MKKTATLLLGGILLLAHGVSAQEARGETALSAGPAENKTEQVATAVADGKSLKETVNVEETSKWWTAKVNTGWDSLYMFRGVNVLGNGNGIYWLGANVGVTPWENGTFTAGIWYGIGTSRSYRELDTTIDYTHTFGPLAASFGYINYYYPDWFFAGNYNQNELYWKLAYTQELGPVTITPSAIYYYELGPSINEVNGLTKPGASYLYLRLDGSMPVYKDIVTLAPWTGFGVNFGYNINNQGEFFTGGNNWELGLSVPVKLTSWLSVSGYVAYSYQWEDLYETDPSQVWAGANVTVSF